MGRNTSSCLVNVHFGWSELDTFIHALDVAKLLGCKRLVFARCAPAVPANDLPMTNVLESCSPVSWKSHDDKAKFPQGNTGSQYICLVLIGVQSILHCGGRAICAELPALDVREVIRIRFS